MFGLRPAEPVSWQRAFAVKSCRQVTPQFGAVVTPRFGEANAPVTLELMTQ